MQILINLLLKGPELPQSLLDAASLSSFSPNASHPPFASAGSKRAEKMQKYASWILDGYA